MHALQVGLHDGAQVLHRCIGLVLGQKVRHIVFDHAGNRHAELVEKVGLVHLQCSHPLRGAGDDGAAQLVLHGDGRCGRLAC